MNTKSMKQQTGKEFLSYLCAGSAILLSLLITLSSCDEPLYAREGAVQTISVIQFTDS